MIWANPLSRLTKRALDVAGTSALGVLLFPVLLGAALTVRLTLGRPIIFRQVRQGWYGRAFMLYKFRTMTAESDNHGELLPDGQRLTSVGSLLRRWSLDELPELWNVLKGDMSLVGPRPLLMRYLPLYSPEQARRHEVRPGLTGLAQVLGRNDTTWERRLELDVWYVDHWTIWLDLRILAMTVRRVLGGRGVSARGRATMPQFQGPASA